MKNHRKSFFTIVLCFAIVIPIFALCINSAVAVSQDDLDHWDRAIIGSANLQPNFQIPSNVKGSYQVRYDRIVPLSSQKQGNYTLFSAKSYFYVDLVLWTEIRPEQSCSATEVASYSDWLQLDTTVDAYTSAWSNYRYAVDWKKFTGITVKPEAKGFEGAIQVNPTLTDLTPSVLDFGNTLINVKAKQFYGVKAQVTVLNAVQENIGNYATIANPVGSVQMSVVDVNTNRNEPLGNAGEMSATLGSYLNNIGVSRMAQYDVTLQQGAWSCPAVGATDVLNNGLRVTIVPDIKKVVEPLSVKNQRIRVDTKTGAFGVSKACVDTTTNPIETTTVTDRPIAWKTENKAMKVSMVFEMNLYSLCEITEVKDTNIPVLTIPETQINDYLWDNTLGGGTGVTQHIDTTDPVAAWFSDLWGNYWYIFLILGLIAITLVVFYLNGMTGGALFGSIGSSIRNRSATR